MKTLFLVLTFAVVSAIAASPLRAQHLHHHGNHWDAHQNVHHGHDAAGHMVDGWGHHIDGHGHHTGWTGVYESGSYSRPWNSYYPTYPAYPTYPSTTYMSPGYVTPGYVSPSHAPSYAPAPSIVSPAPYTTNRIPVPNSAMGPRGGKFVLTNPRENDGPIQYSLNEYTYTINPGETQRVDLDRDWVIRFDNGLSRNIAYRLRQGKYEFTVSPQKGWDIALRVADQPVAPGVVSANVAPSLSTNSIPSSLGSAPPPNTLSVPQ